MDIKTKFNIGSTVLFLISQGRYTNVILMKGEVVHIDISYDQNNESTLMYTVKSNADGKEEEYELEEDILCANDKEVIEYIFKNKNFRRYLNDDHKEKPKRRRRRNTTVEDMMADGRWPSCDGWETAPTPNSVYEMEDLYKKLQESTKEVGGTDF